MSRITAIQLDGELVPCFILKSTMCKCSNPNKETLYIGCIVLLMYVYGSGI